MKRGRFTTIIGNQKTNCGLHKRNDASIDTIQVHVNYH